MHSAHVLRLLAIGALLMICGCNSNNQGKIEGTKWSSLGGKILGVSFTSGTASVEFKKDGKLVFRFGDRTHTGNYALGMGDRVTLNLDKALPNGKSFGEKVSVSDDIMIMTDPDGTKLSFVKEK